MFSGLKERINFSSKDIDSESFNEKKSNDEKLTNVHFNYDNFDTMDDYEYIAEYADEYNPNGLPIATQEDKSK